jgi:hypothetical protein
VADARAGTEPRAFFSLFSFAICFLARVAAIMTLWQYLQPWPSPAGSGHVMHLWHKYRQQFGHKWMDFLAAHFAHVFSVPPPLQWASTGQDMSVCVVA